MPEAWPSVISSAVVAMLPGACPAVLSQLAALQDTEVHMVHGNKAVVVLEGRTRGEVGARLAHIALMAGVVTANMVFEHVEEDKERSP